MSEVSDEEEAAVVKPEGACDDEALMELFNELHGLGDDGWVDLSSSWVNPDFADAAANTARHWLLKDMTGK